MAKTKEQKQAEKADKLLDKQIEAAYYKLANGRQIDIMKIGKLFRDAKSQMATGVPVEDAVKVAIEHYCDPVSL